MVIWRGISLLLAIVMSCFASESIRGLVTDFSGAPLVGSVITVLNLDTKIEVTTVRTASGGSFSIQDLPDGAYSVEAVMNGFLSVMYRPVRVEFPRIYTLSFQLPAAVSNPDEFRSDARLIGSVMVAMKPTGGLTACLSKLSSTVQPICRLTDALGRFFFSVDPGDYALVISSGGNECVKYPLQMPVASNYRRDILIEDLQKCKRNDAKLP